MNRFLHKLWFSHVFVTVFDGFLIVPYGFPEFLSYGFAMVLLWFYCRFPMVFLRFYYCYSLVSLSLPVVFFRFSHGVAMAFLNFPMVSCGFTVVFLWFS